MKRIITVIATLLLLSGCAEAELASHYAKTAFPSQRGGPYQVPVPGKSPIQQGTFKIGKPYKVQGKTYYPQESYDLVETGIASWYGKEFHGKKTANGEKFDMNELTAAHRTLQMPSLVRVTNMDNGRSVIVRVNDRGPYKRSRVMDVSAKAAELLGFKNKGTAKVRIQVLTQESVQLAEIAKSGANTRGFEAAFNGPHGYQPQQAQQLPADYPAGYQVASASGVQPVQNVTRETIIAPPGVPQHNPYNTVIPGHNVAGEFYPDPVVTEMHVGPANIYVQAGSFSVYDNAMRLSQNLSRHGQTQVQPITSNGRQMFRVRLGPINSVAQADTLLSQVVNMGNPDAIIVID